MDDQAIFDRVAEQEARIVFDRFSIDMAIDIGMALVQTGRQKSLPIVVDVTRNTQRLFHCALEGTKPDNANWIERKKNVVQRFGCSSLFMGAKCRIAGVRMEERFMLPPHQFADHGGAFPITLRDSGVIGSVAVSGLPQIDDHEMVVSALEDLMQRLGDQQV